jgi:hypothetical protein
LVFVLLFGTTAGYGHPGYPATVGAALHVDVPKIDPPSGCQLCHTDPAGGTPLRPFGQRLVATYGLDSSPSAENDPSLVQALMGLQMGDPLLAQDLQKEVDPNRDVTNAPTPQYGCTTLASAASRRSAPQGPLLVAGLLVSAFARRRARARRTVAWPATPRADHDRIVGSDRPREHSAESSRKRHRRAA